MKAKFFLSNIKMNPHKYLSLSFALLLTGGAVLAQKATFSPVNLNRWAIGIQLNHLYDVKYTGFDLLSNGFSGEDLRGLNGNKTRFDLALGLRASYFFGPLVSVDAYFDAGKMTGANTIDFYESKVWMAGVSANIDLKTFRRTTPYRWVPFARTSLGVGSYNTNRHFIEDGATFNRTEGRALQWGFGAGVRYHYNANWHAALSAEFVTTATDAWDGYDYGSGRDQLLKTSLGVFYSPGKSDKHRGTESAWKDIRVDYLKDSVDQQMKKGMLAMNDSMKQMKDSILFLVEELKKQNQQKDMDNDGVPDQHDLCPEKAGTPENRGCPDTDGDGVHDGHDRCPEIKGDTRWQGCEPEEPVLPMDKIQIEMTRVYFASGSATLNFEARKNLAIIASLLKGNPKLSIQVSGHADETGSEKRNLQLSRQRAEAVVTYLVSLGIDVTRLQAEEKGSSSPVDTSHNSVSRALNRRVEFKVR